MEALISNETFLKTALLLGWLAIVMLTTSVARYKNRTPAWGWLSLLLGVIALVWLILLPKVSQKKAALKTRRELIIINQAYSMGVWKRKVNNSNLMGLYTKVLRKNEGVDLEYLDSFIKVAIEEKKNTAWSLAYVSVICSFVISISGTLLGSLLKGNLNSAVASLVVDSVFSLILCLIVAISTIGFIHRYTYSKLLYLQEAIRLYKLSKL